MSERGNIGVGLAIVITVIAFIACIGPFIIALFALIFSSDAGVFIFLAILFVAAVIGIRLDKAN